MTKELDRRKFLQLATLGPIALVAVGRRLDAGERAFCYFNGSDHVREKPSVLVTRLAELAKELAFAAKANLHPHDLITIADEGFVQVFAVKRDTNTEYSYWRGETETWHSYKNKNGLNGEEILALVERFFTEYGGDIEKATQQALDELDAKLGKAAQDEAESPPRGKRDLPREFMEQLPDWLKELRS